MKRTTIILFFLMFWSFSNAQVSGYMGKRFSILYSPGISFPHVTEVYNIDPSKPYFSINHAVSFEYLLSKKIGVGLRYKIALNSAINNSYYKNDANYILNHNFRSHTYGFYFKLYKDRVLAPLAFYTKFGINFQNLQLKNFLTLKRDNFGNNIPEFKDYNQFDVLINFGIGKNWIIFDNINLGFELETGIPFLSIVNTLLNIGNSNTISSNNKGTPRANKFNTATEFFKVSMNIGLTAF